IGHENACGVRMGDTAELERFVETMERRAEEIWNEKSQDGSLEEVNRPDLVLGESADADGSLNDGEDLLSLVLAVDSMRPFGHAFPPITAELIVDLSQCHIGS